MSIIRNGRKPLRKLISGAAAAAAATTVLASCAAAGPGADASAGTAGLSAPGQSSSPVISGDLVGVAALSAGNVWAVGSTLSTDPMTVHWNGHAWREQDLTLVKGHPADPPGGFEAVAAVSPHDVWAVGGTAGATLAEHWNGRTWTVVPTPSAGPQFSGIGADLSGAAAVSARDVWAVGSTNDDRTWIIHWNGTAWTRVPSPSPKSGAQLNGVAVASARSAWAVGSYTNMATGRSLQLIEHWNGRTWTTVPSPHLAGGGTLNAVTALAPTDAWAVGTGILHSGQLPPTTVIEHWDGRTWKLVPSPAAGYLTTVTAVSPDSVWAAGSALGGGGDVAVIEHWDGKSWTWPVGSCASPPYPNCPVPPTGGPGSN